MKKGKRKGCSHHRARKVVRDAQKCIIRIMAYFQIQDTSGDLNLLTPMPSRAQRTMKIEFGIQESEWGNFPSASRILDSGFWILYFHINRVTKAPTCAPGKACCFLQGEGCSPEAEGLDRDLRCQIVRFWNTQRQESVKSSTPEGIGRHV